MLQDKSLSEQARMDCALLKNQITQCRSTLAELSRTAELSSVEQTRPQSVGDFVQHTVTRWAVRRPGIRYSIECAASSPVIELDLTMIQALENLLNNAADAGSDRIEIRVDWDQRETGIHIRDWGTGIPPELLEQLGKPIIHAGKSGLGIGLMLTQAAVTRYGGRIELRNIKEGGTVATMSLPLKPASTSGSQS